jgi:hypothetical protein
MRYWRRSKGVQCRSKYECYSRSRCQSRIYFQCGNGWIEIERRSFDKSDEVAAGLIESGIIVQIRCSRRWSYIAISISGLQIRHFCFRLLVDVEQHQHMLNLVRWNRKCGCISWSFYDTTCLTWLKAVAKVSIHLEVRVYLGFPFVPGVEVRPRYMLNPPENLKLYAWGIHKNVRPS